MNEDFKDMLDRNGLTINSCNMVKYKEYWIADFYGIKDNGETQYLIAFKNSVKIKKREIRVEDLGKLANINDLSKIEHHLQNIILRIKKKELSLKYLKLKKDFN